MTLTNSTNGFWKINHQMKPDERYVVQVGPAIVYLAHNGDNVVVDFYPDADQVSTIDSFAVGFNEFLGDSETPEPAEESTGWPVIRQDWEESEAGWGVRRDGYSLHLTEADRLAFIKDYWAGMPDKVGAQPPPEYSRPALTRTEIVTVDEATYQELLAADSNGVHGIRRFS